MLQLYNIKSDSTSGAKCTGDDSPSFGEEWGEFLHLPTGQRFYDFNVWVILYIIFLHNI